MRVTNAMLTANFLSNLNRNLNQTGTYQEQLSTNRRINRPSDDPVGVIRSLAVRTRLSNLEQYNRNVEDAQSWLTQSETAVMDLNEVVQSAYEQALQAGTGTMNATDKKAIATAIGQLREHALQTGNTTLGDKYIFGGYNSSTPPFQDNAGAVLYQGIDLTGATASQIAAMQSQTTNFDIGEGLQTKVSLTGVDLMGSGSDNLIGILDDLKQLLENNGSAGDIVNFADRLKQKQDDLLALAADIGGRTSRLELVTNRYAQDELNYKNIKSSIEDIDTAEVIMKLKMAESVYESALSVGAKVIQPSLVDFLQ